MKINMLKPYWIVGTLITASIAIVGTYNFIVANTQEKNTMETSYIQQAENETKENYQEQINQLMQRLNENEQNITDLQGKVSALEVENSNKTREIANLQNHLQKKNTTTKTVTVNNADLEQVKKKLDTTTEKVEMVDKNVTNREAELKKKKKRLEEADTKLKEIYKKYPIPSHEKYKLEAEIHALQEKEQNEDVIHKINDLKIQLEDIKKIMEEESNLDNEIKKLKQEMLAM